MATEASYHATVHSLNKFPRERSGLLTKYACFTLEATHDCGHQYCQADATSAC